MECTRIWRICAYLPLSFCIWHVFSSSFHFEALRMYYAELENRSSASLTVPVTPKPLLSLPTAPAPTNILEVFSCDLCENRKQAFHREQDMRWEEKKNKSILSPFLTSSLSLFCRVHLITVHFDPILISSRKSEILRDYENRCPACPKHCNNMEALETHFLSKHPNGNG